MTYCISQPPTEGTTNISRSTAAENGTLVYSPLELQPCPDIGAGPTAARNQMFYLNCETCEQGNSTECRLENSLYANECIAVVSGGSFASNSSSNSSSGNSTDPDFSPVKLELRSCSNSTDDNSQVRRTSKGQGS